MRNVVIDIETCPTQNKMVIEYLREKWSIENETKQARYQKDFDEVYRATAVHKVYAEPISICVKIDDEPAKVFMRMDTSPDSELVLLDKFSSYLRQELTSHTVILGQEVVAPSSWIGFNCRDFDLKVLANRCATHGYDPKVQFHLDNPAQIRDYMKILGGYGSNNYLSLEQAAVNFGLQAKSKMEGSQVWDYFQAGRFREIAEYNLEDVQLTYLIHQKWTSLNSRPSALAVSTSRIATFDESEFDVTDDNSLSL